MKSAKILKKYFQLKQKHNPRFSLRSLAKKLGVSPTHVSHILAGKKLVGDKLLSSLLKNFFIDDFAKNEFLRALALDRIALSPLRSVLESLNTRSLKNFTPYIVEKDSVLQKWYYVALLDLMTCDHFKMDISWIAKQLGVTQSEAVEAVHVLTSAQLIEEKEGLFVKSEKYLRVTHSMSTQTIRQFHTQMIEQALHHLNHHTTPRDVKNRLISGITVAVNPKNLQRAIDHIDKALHETVDILTEGPCTEVYQLNNQLFPLTKGEK